MSNFSQTTVERVVVVGVCNRLPSIDCQALSNLEIQESLWCLVTYNRADVLMVGLIYRSPC